MSKKKKTTTTPTHSSTLNLKSSPPKKSKKTKSKKPKNPNPANQPPPPAFYSTIITLQNTRYKNSTVIATTTSSIDKNNQISLFLCISRIVDDNDDEASPLFCWSKIDINSDIAVKPKPKSEPKSKSEVPPLSVICSMPETMPQKFRSVQTLDSKVYALGGIDSGSNPSRIALVYDFSDSRGDWEEIYPMQSPRVSPAAAVSSVDGKVYALGSLDSQLEDPWGEFCDPGSNSWTALPPPPTDEALGCLSDCVFAKDRNQLVCFSSTGNSAYCFDLRDWSWNCINVIGKEASFGLGKTVSMGNVVYTFQKRNLYAFDLSMETPSLEPVYGLEKATAFIGEDDSVFLAYIGFGRMCLVSARQSEDGLLKITCARFSVGTYVRKNRFHAIAVLDNSEEFVAEGIELHDCLAVTIPGEELRYMPSYKDRGHDDYSINMYP
ncbi:hypothetical protein LguiB_021558 [Lonicera macranthoides]